MLAVAAFLALSSLHLGCAARRHRTTLEVHAPGSVAGTLQVMAVPTSLLQRRLRGFHDLAFRATDADGAALPSQLADLDLDGEVESLLVQVRVRADGDGVCSAPRPCWRPTGEAPC